MLYFFWRLNIFALYLCQKGTGKRAALTPLPSLFEILVQFGSRPAAGDTAAGHQYQPKNPTL